ncbi:myosin light chain kinase, smooth muscle isoform X3 [Pangasianodon hypophthalmus]|uniref:myosin light chain kinase, smooth muscle isoform X3 n=1 Tax=Pangasianodon hypophthalmus TaxID=310915 RepID=UPI0023079D1B|nr:myosin light chain kinase, smooth muscle isoform X3 [Pangasianodon hypophthalmus]
MGDVQLVTSSPMSKTRLTLGKSSLNNEAPTFTLPPRNARVSQGGTARLEGKVRGSPEPQVCWFRNGKVVIAGGRYSMEQSARGTFSLVVEGVQKDDAGPYTCEAINDAGTRQITVDIIVEDNAVKKYSLPSASKPGGRLGLPAVENRPSIWGESPPKFVTKPSRLYLKIGQTGKFSVKITGRPQPQIQWFKGDDELQSSDHYNMFERSGLHFLEIRFAHAEDAGIYTCLLANSAGKASATTELIVQDSDIDMDIKSSGNALSKTAATTAAEHKSNGLITDQKSTNTSTHSAITDTHTAATTAIAAKDSPATRPEVQKSAVTSASQTTIESKDERLPEGQQRSSTSITIRSQQAKKSSFESSTKVTEPVVQKKDPDSIRSSGRNVVPAVKESSRETSRMTRESRVEALGSPPSFDLQPQSQEVTQGTKVTFKCQVSGCPVPTVSWVKDGSVLRLRAGISTQQEDSLHLLCVENVQKTDAGQYSCTATNSKGKATCSWTLTVKSPRLEGKAPVFSSALKGCAITEGQNISLQCSVEARPQPTISWLLNDKAISYGNAVFDGIQAQLTIQDALCADEGLYSCVAENEHGRAVCTARVLVKAKSNVKRPVAVPVSEQKRPSPPVFLKELRDLRVMDGSQVTMTVEVTGHPAPEVLWLQNGKEIQESEDFHFESKGSQYSLVIQEVFPEDTGTYTCEAWNEVGEARTEASLTVQEPQDGVQPWFITKPKSTTVCEGQHALLSCAIAGDPFPEFLWMKDGQVVSSGQDFEVLQKEDVVSLFIRRVKADHAGNYEIHLKNKIGDCSAVAPLLVNKDSGHESYKVGADKRSGGVEKTEQDRGEQREAPSSTALPSEPDPVWGRWDPEESAASRGLLKRRVETKEHREDQIRQKEAEQIDFRTVLGRKVTTKSVSEEDLKEITAEQMDFRSNLQRQIKPKTQSEEERKIHFPQQVDFRAVLGKKGTVGPKPASAYSAKADLNKNEPTDFRSVLNKKKKQGGVENNTESPEPKSCTGKENDVNCVHGGTTEIMNAGGGKEPLFTQKLRDVRVLDGERLHLQCQFSAESPATVTWSLDGKVIKPSKFIIITSEGGLCSLTIDKALPEDEGQYVCRAESSAGAAECCCMVQVDDPSASNSTPADKKSKKPSTPTTEKEARIKKPPPKILPKQGMAPQIVQFPEDLKIRAGERVSLHCKFTGAPPINSTWLKFRKPIEDGTEDISIESTDSSSQLTIAHSQQKHCGCYTIEIRNSYGMKQAALNLTIVDKPDPPARIPAVTDIRKSSLTLSWYGPTYDGGSAVQSYKLEIWNSVDKEWKELASCNSTSYNVQNLPPDRKYKFRVRAGNIYGVGEPSAESVPVEVGVEEVEEEDAENKEDDVEPSDDESEKQPEYRDVTIRTDVKVKDFYEVGDRLGSGKFGTVFKLVEKSTKKVWAGKFIKAYSAKEKENVRQEIKIMNDLHHPKLVQCVDAFESKSDMVMVLEMVSGGELFERIIDEDFELTEREVIKYMLQIVDGVNFIHKKGIVHLDLKPENIMCVNKTGSKIKLIDFGLARRLENAGSLKVLFGTPEFVAPEVINYEAISYTTDMWSIGVICYILVSGLSPFMGDNENETLSNVTSATWDFEDEAFDEISDEAKDFISNLLKKDMKARLTCEQCFQHPWLKQDTKNMEAKKLSKERMKKYILRRRWQKTGHAVRAIGRLSSMAMLAGVHAKKGLPAEEENLKKFPEESEQRSPMKPSFSSVIKDVEVVEGSAARFDCKIEGYPDPEVVWYKDDQPIKETRHFQIDYDEEGNCSLVISEVSGDDDAKYTCKAVNNLGEAICTAELIVEVMGGEEEEEEEEEE